MLLNLEILYIFNIYFLRNAATLKCIRNLYYTCFSDNKELLEEIFTDLFSNLFNALYTNLLINSPPAKRIMSNLKLLKDNIYIWMNSGGNNLSGGPGGHPVGPGGGPGGPAGGPGVPGGPGGPGGGSVWPGGGSDQEGKTRKRKYRWILPKSHPLNDENNQKPSAPDSQPENLPKRMKTLKDNNNQNSSAPGGQADNLLSASRPNEVPRNYCKKFYDAARDTMIHIRRSAGSLGKPVTVVDTFTGIKYECQSLNGARAQIAELNYNKVGTTLISNKLKKGTLLYKRFLINKTNS